MTDTSIVSKLIIATGTSDNGTGTFEIFKKGFGNISYDGDIKNGVAHGKGKYYRNKGHDNSLIYEGEFENNLYNGQGTLYFENTIYEGEFKDGLLNGTGIEYYRERDYGIRRKDYELKVYEGDFKDGQYDGNGKLYNDKGQLKYEGKFEYDKRNGIGIEYYPDAKLKYEGYFKDGQYDGTGKLYYNDQQLKYEGDFKDGQYDGTGKLYNPDGSLSYEGTFVNNMYGEGKLYTKDKFEEKIYEGYFKNNLLNGQGKLYIPYNYGYKHVMQAEYKYKTDKLNILNYEGEFIDGKFNGIGTLYYNHEKIIQYKGEFKDDNRNGTGIEYYPDGKKKYEGEWKSNYYNGEGTLYNTDSTVIYKGIFNYGKYKGEKHMKSIVNAKVKVHIQTNKQNTPSITQTNNVDNIKDEIYKLFGGKEKFDIWINKYTPTLQFESIFSIEDINYVFRIIQDITMNPEKTTIESDNTIVFRRSDSKKNDYTLIEITHIINKFANHLYEYLIRENDKNKKKTLFSFLSSKNNNKKTCFGDKYSKLIQKMIIYALNNKTDGLLTAHLPMIINNKTNIPIKPDDPGDLLYPTRYPSNDGYIVRSYNTYKTTLVYYKKMKKYYDENIKHANPEVGDTSLNVIRLIDAFISKLPFKIQNEISIDYMKNFIESYNEGYNQKTCTFDPTKKITGSFYECNQNNLNKLILSLYNVLKNYSDANNSKNTTIKINNTIKCNYKDEKLDKLFFLSADGSIACNFSGQIETYKNYINDMITNFYNEYYKNNPRYIYGKHEKSYRGFLMYIIKSWYETFCKRYSNNENFVLYNFGYMWKQISSIKKIEDIDYDLRNTFAGIKYNRNSNGTQKTQIQIDEQIKNEIERIEFEFIQIPEPCKKPNPMLQNVVITINPVTNKKEDQHTEGQNTEDKEAEYILIAGSKQKTKKLKIKKTKKLKTKNNKKTKKI
jgi:hypothetical protein